jgi:hypothetical protein
MSHVVDESPANVSAELLLADYLPLAEAAKQPRMPGLRTLQRWARERKLPGLVYCGHKPLLHVETFRAALAKGKLARR